MKIVVVRATVPVFLAQAVYDAYKSRDWPALWNSLCKCSGKKSQSRAAGIRANEWLEYFDTLYNVTESDRPAPEANTEGLGNVEMLDEEISQTEVSAIIKKLSKRKSCGHDGIGNEIIKNLSAVFFTFTFTASPS